MIKNLTPYKIEDSDGSLVPWRGNYKVTIDGDNFIIANCETSVWRKILNTKEVKCVEDIGVKIKGKRVYQLSKDDNNFSELYVQLNWRQNLKFQFKQFFKKCNWKKYIDYIVYALISALIQGIFTLLF